MQLFGMPRLKSLDLLLLAYRIKMWIFGISTFHLIRIYLSVKRHKANSSSRESRS